MNIFWYLVAAPASSIQGFISPAFQAFPAQAVPQGADLSVRVFDKTDSPIIQKVYQVEVSNQCPDDVATFCKITSSEAIALTADKDLATCINNLSPSCEITITGNWNYTHADPPRVCATSYLGFKLPLVGGIIPQEACNYGPVVWWGLTVAAAYSTQRVQDLIAQKYCEDVYTITDRIPEACVPRIQWGNDIPGAGCTPPDLYRSSEAPARAFNIVPHPFPWPYVQPIWRKEHINLQIDLESMRTDRKAEGFILAIGGTEPAWSAGTFYGMEVPIKCNAKGRKGTLTVGDEESVNVYEKARKYRS